MAELAKEIIRVNIEDEVRKSYLDYAMSVIVGRALPDVRDGLKPVHRRTLYAMHEANTAWNRPYVKCARVVGEVMGKFHPHGDCVDLRRAGAHGAGFLDALHAHRRPGQLRFGRRRPRRGDALHRVPPGSPEFGTAGRHRQGNRRLPAELRREGTRTDGPADAHPESAGQRFGRHRGRHGDQYPAAQPHAKCCPRASR